MPLKDAEQRRLYNQKYRAEHLEELRAYNRNRYRIVGDRHKPGSRERYSAEHKEESKARNRKSYLNNKETVLKRSTEWHKNNPDKAKESYKKWRNSDKGKATLESEWHKRRALGEISKETVFEVILESKGVCPYCGENIANNGSLDHIIPVSKGGTNERSNLKWCCIKCNMSKGSKDLDEWLLGKRADLALMK